MPTKTDLAGLRLPAVNGSNGSSHHAVTPLPAPPVATPAPLGLLAIAAGAAHEVTGLHEIAGRVVGHRLKCAGPALRA